MMFYPHIPPQKKALKSFPLAKVKPFLRVGTISIINAKGSHQFQKQKVMQCALQKNIRI